MNDECILVYLVQYEVLFNIGVMVVDFDFISHIFCIDTNCITKL